MILFRPHAIIVILSMLFATSVVAQGDLQFDLLSTNDGLSHDRINTIFQDSDGFMWFGTDDGLSRYDGYSFEVYKHDPFDTTSISENHVAVIYEAPSEPGVLWIGTRRGLNRFDKASSTFSRFKHDEADPTTLSYDEIRSIYEDSSGNLWVGTGRRVDTRPSVGGLNRFERSTNTFHRYIFQPDDTSSLSDGNVHTISEDGKGTLWVGTQRGLHRFNRKAGTFSQYLPDPSDPGGLANAILTFLVDENGVVWIGTGKGLARFDLRSEKFTRFLPDPEESAGQFSNYIISVYKDREGVLWLGTAFGVRRFNTSTETFISRHTSTRAESALNQDLIGAMRESREGILWIGTVNGVYRSNPDALLFRHYGSNGRDGLSHDYVNTIAEDASGSVWVGTVAGLDRFDRQSKRFHHFRINPPGPADPNNVVTALLADREHTLWVGTATGLYRFDSESGALTHVNPSSQFNLDVLDGSSIIVNDIAKSNRTPGIVWLGTSRGLCRLDPNVASLDCNILGTHGDVELGESDVWKIFEDRSGELWVAIRNGGIARFNPLSRSITRYQHDPDDRRSLSNNNVWSIFENLDGALWLGTSGGGLNRFDRTTATFTAYTEQNSSVPNNTIHGVLGDDDGNLWISTNRGISRFDPATQSFRNFDADHGLQSDHFNAGAYLRDSEGEMYFGGANGLHVFDPANFNEIDMVPPQVAFTGFQLAGQTESQPWSDLSGVSDANAGEVVISSADNAPFSIQYLALQYRNPSKNQYKYMLEGLDEDWVSAGAQRQVRYPKLEPGEYVFRVMAANSHGVWNETAAALGIVIKPPWWQTSWAHGFYVVVILSIVFGSYRWRVRRLKQHAIKLQKKVDERTEDLRAEKRKTEEQAAKLVELEEVKDRFFANISHEFRTPLTVMLGPVQDALSGAYGSVPPKLGAQLEVMHRNGERLHRLINELLDLSKLEIGRMRLYAGRKDLVSFIREIVLSFSSAADRRKITLRCQSDVDELPLYFDAGKLDKVITNLLSNALKFTPENGKVWVSIHDLEQNTNGAAGPFAEICVKDTGPGIPAVELPHIFDRFHQVDNSMTRKHEGSGIGLALAKELVELHGGTISVESDEGFGTTFTIRLPKGKDHLDPDDLVDDLSGEGLPAEMDLGHDGGTPSSYRFPDLTPEVVAERDIESEDESPPDSAPTILIVEDSEDVREYLKSHLASIYHIVEARDGEEGLEKARESVPDLVISDIMMPNMDGISLCERLKHDEDLNHIPVILLTSKATDASAIEGFATGADDYIYKPFNAEVLLARVENLIELRRILRRRFSDELRVGPSEVAVPSEEAAFIEHAREVVERHLGDSNFNVDWFAEEVGMSRRHLHRRLRESIDLSPAGYIRMMRLERAAQLLEQNAGSISEIAYQVGFKNADHFSRLFHQTFGVPPSEYPPK